MSEQYLSSVYPPGITVVQLHEPIAFLKFILDKFGCQAVSPTAPGKPLKQVGDCAQGSFLFLGLFSILPFSPLYLWIS